MKLRTVLFIFALLVSSILQAQEAKGPYKFKSGSYTYKMSTIYGSGSMEGCWDDYGNKEMRFASQNSMKTLRIDGKAYQQISDSKFVEVPATTPAFLLPPSTDDDIKEIGTGEINGYDCTILEVASSPKNENEPSTFYRFWVWDGMVIQEEILRGDICLARSVMTDFQTNIDIDPTVFTLPEEKHDWQSLGMGSFIDNRIWALAGYPAGKTVSVEIFEDMENPGKYRIPNPYGVAAKEFGRDVKIESEFLSFSYTINYVAYSDIDTGLFAESGPIGISSDINNGTYHHVISSFEDGKPAVIQIAPKYSDDSFESRKEEYHAIKNEPSKNGAVMIAFPGAEILPFIPVSADRVTVSADQMKTNRYKPTDDGWGPMGLVDDNTTTFWHTPYAYVDTNPSPVYGQYVDFALPAAVSSFYFNYCTRTSPVQSGAPARIVIGGSNNGKKFTVLAEFSHEQLSHTFYGQWIGLPMVNCNKKYKYLRFGIVQNQKGEDLRIVASKPDEKWVNLAELHLYGK